MRIVIQVAALAAGLCLAAQSGVAIADIHESASQRAVLVTGASSGIGRKITEVLAEEGHFVYAGARKQADIDALNAIDNVQAVRLDVTIQEDIDARPSQRCAQAVAASGGSSTTPVFAAAGR
jgi:NAD(P)-dependent dehydrogenase (short-subunit alcohol dehydrogenase family)